MANRSHTFAAGEHYHCYNRGTEKRNIFCDQQDYIYFLQCLRSYNTSDVLGKMRLYKHRKPTHPPVTILSYCLLPNHFHLLLRNEVEYGISKYMQRVTGGYTMYFNKKYNRSGGLFQGAFKSKYVATDQDMRQLLAYVSMNHKIHNITDESLFRASINTNDNLIRGMTENLPKDSLKEIVEILKEKRLTSI